MKPINFSIRTRKPKERSKDGPKRKLYVNHRNHPELVEALANVPRGTFYKYEALKETIPESQSTAYWSNEREVKLAEKNFKLQLKKFPQLKRLHSFMNDGLGEIEASLPGRTKGAAKIKKILTELYFHDQKFRKFYINSPYVKNWYDYVHLVRSVGIYW